MHFPGKTEEKHRKRFSLICYALHVYVGGVSEKIPLLEAKTRS